MSISINVKVDKLNDLKEYVDYVKGLSKMQNDTKFQKFIQDKCLETVRRITDKRLTGGTTNDDLIGEYKSNHKIRNFDNGFILYNDTQIPADYYNVLPFDTSGYPNGMFSVALAFEYGVGIVGESSYGTENGYIYNNLESSKSPHHKDKKYNTDEWFLPKKVYGESGIISMGYQGFEIYRYTAAEIEDKLPKWVKEYMKKERGVNND